MLVQRSRGARHGVTWCHVESGSLTLKEHEAARWLTKEQLDSVEWLPADKVVVEQL